MTPFCTEEENIGCVTEQVLPCNHSICSTCRANMDEHGLNACPLCRAPLSELEEEEENASPRRRPGWAVDPTEDALTVDDLINGDHEHRSRLYVYDRGYEQVINRWYPSFFYHLLRFGHRPEDITVYRTHTVPEGSFWRGIAGVTYIDRLVQACEHMINIEEGELRFVGPVLERLDRFGKAPAHVVVDLRFRGDGGTDAALRTLPDFLKLPSVLYGLAYAEVQWLTHDDDEFARLRSTLSSLAVRGVCVDTTVELEDNYQETTITATARPGLWHRFVHWMR